MPYKSDKQRRFFNSPTGKAKIGAEKVNEFNKASKGMKLPEVAEPKPDAETPAEDAMEMPTLSNRFTHKLKGY